MNSNSYIKNFVKVGWFSLHNSVLAAGAEIDSASYSLYEQTTWIDFDSYTEVLTPVIKITSVIIQSPTDDGDLVAKKIWGEIRKIKTSSSKHFDAFNRMTANELRVTYNDWHNKEPQLSLAQIDYKDPITAAKEGWKLIIKASQTNSNAIFLFWGLALIGWVDTILSNTRICQLCFRWSLHGSQFCFQHTQSKNSEQGPSKAYSSYRKGKLLLKNANKNKVTIRSKILLSGLPYVDLILADFLFFNSYSIEECIELQQVLALSPNVLNFIGGEQVLSLDKDSLHEVVRKKLNPPEYQHSSLCYSIVMAEKEFTLPTRNVGRPKGGKSNTTTLKIEKVLALAEAGYSKTEIAKQLNISKSTLSNWISRYSEVKSAFIPTVRFKSAL